MKLRTKVTFALTLLMTVAIGSSLFGQQTTIGTLTLTIDQALEIAVNENLSVKIADEEIKRVDWLKTENWYSLMPSLNANAQYTNNILKPVFFSDFFPGGKMEIGATNSYAVSGVLQVPVFSLALFKSIQLSELDLKSALESARSTKIELISQVKNSFYGILMLEQSLEVLQESYKNAGQTAQNIKNMYENGLASEYDKIRSDVAVRNLLPTITQAANGLELAKMQLKVLLSLDLETPLKLAGSISDYEMEIAEYKGMGPMTLDNNSSLRSVDIQLEKLCKTHELIRSQRLPSLAGFANYQLQMQSEEFTFNRLWTNSVAVGLVLQIPIFNKLSISLKEKQTQVGIRQMSYQREIVENNLTLALRNSLNEMNRAKIQLESDKEAVMQAKKGYEIAKVRYSTGTGTLLELNDTEVALTRSQLNLNQTIYDFIKARNEYEKVTGRDTTEIINN
jgi:outer membrane protein TolC